MASCCKTYDPCLDNKINQVGSYASVARQSAASAQNAWLEFNALYLGAFAAAPTVDNQGNPLQVGALYFNTGSDQLFTWNGTTWVTATGFNEFTPFLATGTATPRNLVSREADVINVKDFGAVGDGIVDDTAAIQAAINQAGAEGGGIVFLPSGSYLVSGPIQQPFNGVTIEGEGQRATNIIRNSDWNHPILGNNLFVFAAGNLIPEEGGVVNNIVRAGGGVCNLTIISNSKMQAKGSLIYCLNSKEILLENLELYNGYIAITCKGVINSTINNVYITADLAVMNDTMGGDTKAISLEFSRGTFKSNTIRFENLFISSSFPPSASAGYFTNVLIESADGTWFSNCYFGGAANKNMLLAPRVSSATSPSGEAANLASGIKITACWFDYSIGVSIEQVSTVTTVRNVEIIGCTFYLLNGFGANAIIANSPLLNGLAVLGGRIADASVSGIRLIEGSNIRITAMTIVRCNLSNTASIGCININTAGISDRINGVIISECQLGTNGMGAAGLTTHGVLIGAGTKNYNVSNNDLRGNSSAGLFTNADTSASESAYVARNIGYRTENSGFAVFNPGETSKTVNHGLARAPLRGDINIIAGDAAGAAMGVPWVSNITSTQFTISFASSPAAATTIRWDVDNCSITDF